MVRHGAHTGTHFATSTLCSGEEVAPCESARPARHRTSARTPSPPVSSTHAHHTTPCAGKGEANCPLCDQQAIPPKLRWYRPSFNVCLTCDSACEPTRTLASSAPRTRLDPPDATCTSNPTVWLRSCPASTLLARVGCVGPIERAQGSGQRHPTSTWFGKAA